MKDVSWKRWMMRRVLKDTLVLAQSEEIRKDVRADFSDIDCAIEVLGNAVSIPNGTASGNGVLYVGRLAPKKGLEYLIEAMTDLDTQLTIVGDGPERERLEAVAERIDGDISFEGEVPPEEVDKYYRSAAIFVLPSIEGEGMPNVVLEAMAWGLPVVATDSGGIPSVIQSGKNGYLVPMHDTESLHDKIRKLQNDSSERDKLGKHARQYVQKTHSWNSLVSKLEEKYRKLS